MSKITAITWRNFKGSSGVQTLTGKDIIIGDNGSGKSTRVEALQLAMLGQVQSFKNEQDIFGRFAPTGYDEMEVGLSTESGFASSRLYKRNTKTDAKTGAKSVSISQSLEVSPGRGEKTDTQRKARIVDEVGAFSVSLNFDEFLALSDAKRREFFYKLAGFEASSWNKEKLREVLLQAVVTEELQRNDPDFYALKVKLVDEALSKYPNGAEITEGLIAVIDWVDKQLTKANTEKRDALGAVRTLADYKNELEETDRELEKKGAELAELRKKIVEVSERISRDEERKRIVSERLQRVKEIEEVLKRLEESPVDTDTTEIDGRIMSKQKQKKTPVALDGLKAIEEKGKKEGEELRKVESELSTVKGKIAGVKAQIEALDKILEQVGSLAGGCVIAPKLIKCERDFSGFGPYVEKKKSKLKEEIAALEAEEKALEAKADGIRKSIEADRASYRKTLEEAKAVQEANAKIDADLKELEAIRSKKVNARAQVEMAVAAKRQELEAAREKAQQQEQIGDIEMEKTHKAALEAQVEELAQVVKDKQKARETILLLQQSLIEGHQQEQRAITLKQIKEKLGPKGVQGEIVKSTLDPIRGEIRENLALCGYDFEPYFMTESETGKEVFRFGWINAKGHRVDFDALSDGQKVIFLACILAVIIERAAPKVKLLVIDNVNHLTKRNFEKLVKGLGAIADRLDNVILSGAIEPGFEADGWTVTELEISDVKE